MIADATIALILQAAGDPPGIFEAEEDMVKSIKSGDAEGAQKAEAKLIAKLLHAQYGCAEINEKQGNIIVQDDDKHKIVNERAATDKCPDAALQARVV